MRLSAIAAALADAAHNRRAATVMAGMPIGWRNVSSGNQHKTFRDADGTEHSVAYRHTRTGLHLPNDPDVALVSATPAEVVLSDESDGAAVATAFAVARYGEQVYVDSPLGAVAFTALTRFPRARLAGRAGIAAGTDARHGDPVGRGTRRHRHHRAAPWCGWRR